MMEKEYIVRADFYPNGKIMPLGITKSNGETIYIQKSIETISESSNQVEFICFTEKGQYKLLLKKNKWIIYNV